MEDLPVLKTGSLIGGIILLIIGVAGYISLQSNVSDCQSLIGQAGRFISTDFAERCSLTSLGQIIFGIIFVIGIGVLIYGAVAKRHSVFICGYCNYLTEIEPDLYEHYERTHRQERQREEERSRQVIGGPRPPTKYDILGVPATANDEEIKKAYRTLSIIWHPDRNRTKTDAAEYFKIINEAYEVLRDKDKRRAYDKGLGIV